MHRSRSAVLVVVVLVLGAGFASPAYCYLDPGTGSMILQGLLAAVAGAAMALKIYWHRLSSVFKRKHEPKADEEG